MPGNPAHLMSVEKLLEHGPSLRRLALDLARDEAGAEDLVQETWMVALRREPPAEAQPGPWLRGVLRNVFRGARRGEHRRQRREALASRREAAPDPSAGLLERAEILRRIVGHILELDPIYREAILLRYFEDLSTPEVAERLGVPVDTVHTRVRRGIEKLRGSLDAEHGGERRGWALVLLPGVPRAPRGATEDTAGAEALSRGGGAWTGASMGLGGLVMSMKTVIPAAALAATLLGLGAIALLRELGPPSERELRHEMAVTIPGSTASPDTGLPSPEALRKEEAATVAPVMREGAELIARIRGPGGEPVAGAALEAVRISMVPRTLTRKEDTAARGASDGEGVFRFRGLEPGTYEVRALSADHRPERSEEVDIDETNPGEVEIELAVGLALEGVVVGPAGRPVADAVVMTWRTSDYVGPSFAMTAFEGYEPAWAAAELRTRTDEQGRFRLNRLPSGNRQLLVRHPDWAPAERGPLAAGSRGIEVRLDSGATVQGRVWDAAGGRVEGLLVRAFVRNHHPMPEGLRARFESKVDASGAFLLEKVPREPLRIQVPRADGRTETLDVDVPERGDLNGIEIVLTAGGSVRGRVLSPTGNAIAGVAISLVEMTELGRVVEASSLDDGTFTISGVNTGIQCSLSIRSADRPVFKTRVQSTPETDVGDVVLEDGLSVSGVIVSTKGAPIHLAHAWIYEPHDGGSWHCSETPRRSDESGRFSFDGLRPGTYRVHATAKGFTRGFGPSFTLGRDEDPLETRVILAEGEPSPGRRKGAALTGWVHDAAEGQPIREFQVFVDDGTARSRGRGNICLDPEGRFLVDALEPGERTVRIFVRGYMPHETRISLEPGETGQVFAEVERGASVSGRLTNAGGNPVTGARVFTVGEKEARQYRPQGTTTAYVNAADGLVSALSFDVGLPDEARSGDDGTFLLEGVRPGPTLLRIDHPRFSKRILGPIDAPAEGLLSLGDIRLDSGAAIEGIVLGAEGRPVRGGTVHIQPMGDDGPVDTYLYVPIGKDGTYRKEGLEPGRVWIRIYGIEETGREVELELGSTLRADFRIPATE